MSDIYGNETLVPEYRRCAACNEPMTMVIHMINSADPKIRKAAHKFLPAVSLQKGETMPQGKPVSDKTPMYSAETQREISSVRTGETMPKGEGLTLEQVTAALDKAIGAVIDPVPDVVPKNIVRRIQMERLTDELNAALQSVPSSPPPVLQTSTGAVAGIAPPSWSEPTITMSSDVAKDFDFSASAPSDAGQPESAAGLNKEEREYAKKLAEATIVKWLKRPLDQSRDVDSAEALLLVRAAIEKFGQRYIRAFAAPSALENLRELEAIAKKIAAIPLLQQMPGRPILEAIIPAEDMFALRAILADMAPAPAPRPAEKD